MTKSLFAIAAISILTLTSCTTERIVYVDAKHDVPARPYLPKVSDGELSCLADQTYERLAKRDQAWRLYTEKLELLLK
jgi:hypothetical protein